VTVDPRPSDIWVVDLHHGQLVRVTTEGHNIKAVWAPDGVRLAFYRDGAVDWVGWQSGAAPEPVLLNGPAVPADMFPTFWTRDGRILAQRYPRANADIVTLGIGDSVARPLLATPASETQAMVSPDGHWLSFCSNLTGSNEVYVRPYPAGGRNLLVSTRGGTDPRWSADGRELYFREGSRIMAAAVRTSPTFETLGPPQLLFSGTYDFSQEDNWDVGPDGRFIMVRGDPASRGQFLVVLSWFAELKNAVRAP
jgi:eukaryotic-like serine/threonine-protein kinase